jgi:hypothetical protein
MSETMIRKLEKRIELMENDLRHLKNQLAEPVQPWWERTAGMFKDSPIFDEIVKAGAKFREADREAARSAYDALNGDHRAKQRRTSKKGGSR